MNPVIAAISPSAGRLGDNFCHPADVGARRGRLTGSASQSRLAGTQGRGDLRVTAIKHAATPGSLLVTAAYANTSTRPTSHRCPNRNPDKPVRKTSGSCQTHRSPALRDGVSEGTDSPCRLPACGWHAAELGEHLMILFVTTPQSGSSARINLSSRTQADVSLPLPLPSAGRIRQEAGNGSVTVANKSCSRQRRQTHEIECHHTTWRSAGIVAIGLPFCSGTGLVVHGFGGVRTCLSVRVLRKSTGLVVRD
jgi:hypothetical protein